VGLVDWIDLVTHYLVHPKPVLIRGGAQMPPEIVESYSREGLLKIAGGVKLKTFRIPYGDNYPPPRE